MTSWNTSRNSQINLEKTPFSDNPIAKMFSYILGLKKVTDDMKTHKNPTLRGQSTVPAAKTSNLSPRPYAPATFKKFTAPETKKPPVFELQMKKWIVVC